MPNHLTRKVKTREADLQRALRDEAAKPVEVVAVKKPAEQLTKRAKPHWLDR